MKRVVAFALAIMFFVGSLFPRVSAEQAAHLPELMAHYHEHQREEGCDLSFWAFLVEHYVLDSHHHKAPNHSHSRLPTLDNHSSAYDFTQLFRLVCELFITELDALAIFRIQLMTSQQAFSSLLQPPRF
ncbi:hypothetical protein ACFSUS_22380 [Spirosoma soli]|uniref:Uncharacterized protein n=1 Tax=Spirosoma soli TaxID=1770529 RepID=A0ABW5M8V9_9BACT